KVRAKLATAPADCQGPPPAQCGNGVVDGAEECDDGGTADGDGCSATCQLENTSAVCAGMPTTDGTALGTVLVAGGLTRPLYVTAPPLDTSRIFILEQDAFLRILST